MTLGRRLPTVLPTDRLQMTVGTVGTVGLKRPWGANREHPPGLTVGRLPTVLLTVISNRARARIVHLGGRRSYLKRSLEFQTYRAEGAERSTLELRPAPGLISEAGR